MKKTRAYLDASILIKRCVKEENSDIADNYFHQAHRGESVICISEINLGEATGVLNKYSRKIVIDAKSRIQTMMDELKDLERSSSIEIHPVSSRIIMKAIKIVLEQHIYIIDTIQLETSAKAGSTIFCSADMELNAIARKLGIATAL